MGIPDILLQSVLARPTKMRISVELAYVKGRDHILVSHRVTEGDESRMLCAGTGALILPDTIREISRPVSTHTERLISVSLASYAPELDPPF